jgi:predicted DNA-binding ArsR family transcriptional regulator|tara:strand:- start:3425 stop:3634 length:210 start_codon:yes stop_codon:yes gene_type:complete
MADQAIRHAMKIVKDMADIMAATGMSREQINEALQDAMPAVNQIITAERDITKAERLRRTLLQAIERHA